MKKEVTTNELMEVMCKQRVTTDNLTEMMHEQRATTNELMEFLQENVATRYDIEDLRKDIRVTEHRIMDAMDDKLADLKGDLVVLMRQGNGKLSELLETLKKRGVISGDETDKILRMKPFAEIG